MGKTNSNAKSNATPKKAKSSVAKKSGGGGLGEIDSLFAQKKQCDKELQQQIDEEKEQARHERKRRKQARLDEEADEIALRGSSGSSATGAAAASGKGGAAAPASLHAGAQKLASLTYTRADVEQLNDSAKSETKNKWASDGLGGVFNGEGYTGRKDDGGQRVFKAHLMNKKGFGESPDCPFDCDCCFI